MRLGVITVSVREGRIGGAIAKWAYEHAKKAEVFDEVELIDLKEIDLPVFNEPNHPTSQEYVHDKTKSWSKTIDQIDAFLFVTPEYDYFAPSSLVNAIQYLAKEWNYKPASFVGYGGVSGGTRSIQSVKPLLTTVKVMPIPEFTTFQFAWNSIEDGRLNAEKFHEESLTEVVGELRRWSEALEVLRRPAA